MSKLSKQFRSFWLIKLLINVRFTFTKKSVLLFTVIYLKLFRNYKKIKIVEADGRGAGFYATAFLDEKKVFLKIANRKNSSKKEPIANKMYHTESKAFIKLISYNYSCVINYISFNYIEFVNLYSWIQHNSEYQQSFLGDLVEIAVKLKRSRVNHKDITEFNIAVIKNGESIRLELFDFGVGEVNSKDFLNLFNQDLQGLSQVAARILSQKDFDLFKNKIALL